MHIVVDAGIVDDLAALGLKLPGPLDQEPLHGHPVPLPGHDVLELLGPLTHLLHRPGQDFDDVLPGERTNGSLNYAPRSVPCCNS